jgi:hypothetical protein
VPVFLRKWRRPQSSRDSRGRECDHWAATLKCGIPEPEKAPQPFKHAYSVFLARSKMISQISF